MSAVSVRKRVRGFTLIEVLVSLAIVAMSAVVLGTAYVNVLYSYHSMQGRDAEESDAAHARLKVMMEPEREVVEQGGRMERPGGGSMRWDVEIQETAQADLFWVALQIEFTPASGGTPRLRKEYFHVLRPTWSDPARRTELRAEFRKELEKRRGA